MVQENSINSVVICVATATGKTSLAANVAQKLGSEVISADSMLIYKGFDIGTAKPEESEKLGVKHHLIDVISGKEEFSVSDYESMAGKIADELIEKGKNPVICGGTGFYINSLLFDLSYGNAPKDDKIREKYDKINKEYGSEYLYDLLKKADPVTAGKLHPNDVKRVIRALEIFESTGKKKSDINDGEKIKRPYKAYAVDFEREVLYKRIDERVEIMFEKGLVSEVASLLSSGVTFEDQSMQGIGYKEFCGYFNSAESLDQVKETIKLNTRHYAKRQITFFKRLKGIMIL